MSKFDLVKYLERFDEALHERYGKDFKAEFDRIKNLYKDVGSGKDPLTVDHVMAIFKPDLPFFEDWTKPDRECLAERMEAKGAAKLIVELGKIQPPLTVNDRKYYLDRLGKTIYCFRELTLTALVLQHVYPERFAMCSHHLASQLYITAPTVPEFYAKYCEELKVWSEHRWPTSRKLNVLEAEYALWTWYRLAYHGKDSDRRRRLQREFSKDLWVQKRRAKLIADSLKDLDRLDLARSYLDTDPTVAVIIAWREFEAKVREVTNRRYEMASMVSLIDSLPPNKLPPNQTQDGLKDLWYWRGTGRNPIMHQGSEISDKAEAERVLNGVVEFIEYKVPAITVR